MKYPSAIFLALLLFSGTAFADRMADAKAAFARKDYGATFSILEELSKAGDVEAEMAMGMMYENGRGATQDYRRAFAIFHDAAGKGSASAECRIGLMYKAGRGVKQNDAEAVKWLLKSARQGDVPAQDALAEYYETGATGVPQDFKEAFFWQLVVADQRSGYPFLPYTHEAYKNLGFFQVLETVERAEDWKPEKEGAANPSVSH